MTTFKVLSARIDTRGEPSVIGSGLTEERALSLAACWIETSRSKSLYAWTGEIGTPGRELVGVPYLSVMKFYVLPE